MGYYCCVPLCNSNSKRKNGVSFHGFTKDRLLRDVWLANIRRDLTGKRHPFRINHHTKICSLHFLKSDFKIASEKWRLKPNAVPTIFAWTNKKPDSNIIKIPTYVPKANHEENISQETDEQCEKVQTINKNDSIPDVSEEKNMQNEDDHKNAESNVIQTSGKIYKEDNLKPEEYKSMYFNLLSENRYLKNELESLSYKYRDQEELYENLVVVNKTTEKENAEFRQTIALLQECLRNTVQKEVQVKGQLPTKLSAHFIKERIQDKTVVL